MYVLTAFPDGICYPSFVMTQMELQQQNVAKKQEY
jgi:hypothetical protein